MAKARATGPTRSSSAVEASTKSSKDQSIPSFSLISPPLIHVKYRKFAVNLALSAGDCVLMRPSKSSKPPNVAKVEKIESDSRGGNVKVHVRRYYRPEESIGRRRQFHGYKELFLSDHHDIQSADTIEGKCTVHSFKSYRKLDAIGHNDFFWRFEYNSTTGAFSPDQVAVYCICEMPCNPDDVMVKCQDCKDWFHPACVSMTQEEATTIEHFICQTCAPEEQNNLQI